MLVLKLSDGRTLYYGKGDVLSYRTYATPLDVQPIPESAFAGSGNVIFAHNIKFSVSSERLLPSFTEGGNALVVATDSMKNFILRETARYEGSTTEGLLAFIGELFLEKYPHVTAIEAEGHRLPFETVQVRDGEGFADSPLVYRPSHNDRASANLALDRAAAVGARIVSHECALSDLQLIKVSGSSFYGFIRDEYTTLPESYDRPLFIFLDIFWTYADAQDALHAERGRYVAAELVRDLAHHVFHEFKTPSIQYLIYRIGLRMLKRFPQLSQVRFESNNRTWETVVEPVGGLHAGVYTEPRPPFGFQGFTMTQADLAAAESNGSEARDEERGAGA
ncbi:factor-independent urate hydroxylase [Cohnella nanjingensis]|uniref:Uricase n=1 Tax=Cohnella nanjingensis TaxID=1387779 RepID=A0A7X0RXG3_9BACL|nr:urate oxidase [Cohnella nanjingensis]MBB6675453.1 urate oxidase [Cohnella nanjingensis]